MPPWSCREVETVGRKLEMRNLKVTLENYRAQNAERNKSLTDLPSDGMPGI